MPTDPAAGHLKMTGTSARPIAIYMPAFADGGAEKAMFRLAGAFAEQGLTVDFVVDRDSGPNRRALPPTARVAATTACCLRTGLSREIQETPSPTV